MIGFAAMMSEHVQGTTSCHAADPQLTSAMHSYLHYAYCMYWSWALAQAQGNIPSQRATPTSALAYCARTLALLLPC